MPVSAVVLFGSYARGDQDSRSDTDLLMVTAEEVPRHNTSGHLSTSFYPFDNLRHRARNGDLFVCHIVREGKALYDPTAQLDLLRSEFRFRPDYALEVQQATDLGWFLTSFCDDISSASLVNRRIAWCVRTILISRSAEAGTPVFSAADLANFSASEDVGVIIKNKDNKALDSSMLQKFEKFLNQFGDQREVYPDTNLSDVEAIFNESSNSVALSVLKTFDDDASDY